MANGGIIGPVNTVTDAFKDKVTAVTSTGTFNRSTANPAAPNEATVIVISGGAGSASDAGGAGGAGGIMVLVEEVVDI